MAKVSLDLNQFKANGVYTVEYDESEQTVINSQQLRLIVGFSRKGPFNAPVFLKDTKSARKIFGGIDTLLEKKGSFFHRSIETALKSGPVYAINLLPLDNTPTGDKIEYRSFSISMNETNSDVSTALYSSFYNKERFWKPDTSYFEAIVNGNTENRGKLISFTNLGQSPVSLIVRKAKALTGFDITARDFYGEDDVPAYVNKFAYIKDYFIDIYAVKGDWTDYANLSIDPDYSTFFTETGIKVDMLDKFLASDKITMIGSWTGCIIPDFIDKTGANQYIETIVNSSQSLTGIYMTINRDALDDYENSIYHVDMIGNSILDNTPSTINMLSYVSPLSDKIMGTSTKNSVEENVTKYDYESTDFSSAEGIYPFIKCTPYSDVKGHFFNTLVIPKPRAAFKDQVFTLEKYVELASTLNTSSLLKTATSFVKVYSVVNTGDSLEIIYTPNYDVSASPSAPIDMTSYESAGKVKFLSNKSVEFVTDSPIESTPFGDTCFIYVPSKKAYAKLIKNGSTWEIESEKDTDTPEYSWYKKFEDFKVGQEYDVIYQGTIGDYIDFIPSFATTDDEVEDLAKGTIEIAVKVDLIEKVEVGGNFLCFRVYPGNELYSQIDKNSIINGDKVAYNETGYDFNYLGFEKSIDEFGLNVYDVYQYVDDTLVNLAKEGDTLIDFTNTYSYDEGKEIEPEGDETFKVCIVSDHNTISLNVPFETISSDKTEIELTSKNASSIEVGQYLVSEKSDGTKVLTRVISKVKKIDREKNVATFTVKVNEPLKVYGIKEVRRYLDINDNKFTTTLQFTKLGGFKLTNYHLPDGTDAQLSKILSVLEDTNVGKTLSDNDIIQFRYIVDTFDGGIAPMMGPKVILSRLAMKKQKCMALLNAPSIGKMIDSVDPMFTDAPDPDNGVPKPLLNCEYIAQGGNLALGPANKLTLPDEDNGAKFCGVFTPFIKIREFNKDKMIPPAADVSNNFINKFTTGQPYSIAAGPRRGIISNSDMTGLEYEFLREERGYLEPVGYNCIVDDRQYGPMIYGNATAYQKTLTAFNNLHVRDLLITIETDIEDILSNYVFEFNDAATRLEMKTLVENYLRNVKTAQGIYDFMVIMDESNNTPTVIDQNIGIMDIGIEPARGMHKIINRVTVLKTGTISSGGFTIN